MPGPRRQPNLWLATTQYLVGPAGMPANVDELRALWQERRDEVLGIVRTRTTQTNEVGRCAVWVPALATVPGPVALLEVGASAGLNLLLDRFAYRWSDGVVLGDGGEAVEVTSDLRGEGRPVRRLPDVVWRSGIDIAPADVHDEDAVRWLAACVWPDQPERRRRLLAAAEVARRDRPRVVRGDLVRDLATVATGAPGDATLVVFHSAVLAYVDEAARDAFVAELTELARKRPVVRFAFEGHGVVRQHAARFDRELSFVVGRTTFEGDDSHDEVLALADGHGAALEWLAAT